MRTKLLIAVSVLILAALLSACGPSTVYTQAAPRTMNVTGAGQAYLDPDIAYIYIGVHTEGASASEAVAENNARTKDVSEALKGSGVDAKDIRTTNFSIWPSQQYDDLGQPTSTIYMVDNTVYVTVRDMKKLGELLDATIQAGANSINSIQFDVADKTEALSQARKLAVENAEQQAQELAEAAGVSLGDIYSISYYDTTPYPMMDAYGKGGGGGAVEAAVPIQPGQLTLTATVSIAYELK